MTNVKKTRLIIRIILIAIPVVFFGWLTAKNFVISGVLDATYDFKKPSPFIAELWTPTRLTDPFQRHGEWVQVMRADPVTTRVTLPRSFSDATVEVRYRLSDPEQPFHIGMRKAPNAWAWDIRDLNVTQRDGWLVGTTTFRGLPAYAGGGRQLDLLFNAPGLIESGNTVTIGSIRVIATREPVTGKNVWERTTKYVGKFFGSGGE